MLGFPFFLNDAKLRLGFVLNFWKLIPNLGGGYFLPQCFHRLELHRLWHTAHLSACTFASKARTVGRVGCIYVETTTYLTDV
jgi:hypothetical protein